MGILAGSWAAIFGFILASIFGIWAQAAQTAPLEESAPSFKKVMIIILENTNYEEALAQPFLGRLAREGALLTNFHAETHPSQPNYIALISGDTHGVRSDKNATVDARHIGDLLEDRHRTWKVYAEGYPGNCFLGARQATYVRKHVPFLSFKNVQGDPGRCGRVVDASALDLDIQNSRLPDFSLYIPDLDNDGHDKGVAFADRWLAGAFGPRLRDARFIKTTLLIVTFDENESLSGDNRIYTALYGAGVRPGSDSDLAYSHYSLLRTIEDAFQLGTLGLNDADAGPITGVWR